MRGSTLGLLLLVVLIIAAATTARSTYQHAQERAAHRACVEDAIIRNTDTNACH